MRGHGRHVQHAIVSARAPRGRLVDMDVQNLLDTDLPYCSGNTGRILGGARGCNGFVSNPPGRLASLGLRSNFDLP